MTQWSDLPREIQTEILKFVVAVILQDHIDRVLPGLYWGSRRDYVYAYSEHPHSYISDGFGHRFAIGAFDERQSDIDKDSDADEDEGDAYDFDDDSMDLDWEHDIHTHFGDGCSTQKEHESSRFTSLFVVSKAFFTSKDLKSILRRYGHVNCPSPKYLAKLKDSLTIKERRKFSVMWIRPRNAHVSKRNFQLFGPDESRLSLYQFLMVLPNLKLINLQLEEYLRGRIRLHWRHHSGRIQYPTECQNVLDSLYYRVETRNKPASWVQRLVSSAIILDGKVEVRLSFGADISDEWEENEEPCSIASFSSKDFCVRLNYEGEEWLIKQPRDEQYYREEVLEEGKRSSFKNLPGGLQALISAKARNKK